MSVRTTHSVALVAVKRGVDGSVSKPVRIRVAWNRYDSLIFVSVGASNDNLEALAVLTELED